MNLSSLSSTNWYRLGVVAAFIIALPLLGMGFFLDDYLHLATIEGHNTLTNPYDLYVFSNGNAADAGEHVKTGPYPWFMDPEFKVHFFRPLASILMVLDHAIFHHFSPGYAAHSILWHVLLACGAMLVLRRSMLAGTGILALLLYVLDESHAFPVGWWSNRHSVMAVAFGFLGIAAHLRWREDAWKPGLPMSIVLYLLALLSAETGLCVMAYIPAYELFGAKDKWTKRFVSLVPATIMALSYFLLYRWHGYGAQFSDIYIDPGANPLAYLSVAPLRFLMLALTQFFMFPCEITIAAPALEPAVALGGAIALTIIAVALKTLWPKMDARDRQALRWLIPGAIGSSLPILAAIVTSRTLLAASLGGAAVLAVIIRYAWIAQPSNLSRSMRFLMGLLIVLHLCLAPLAWPLQSLAIRLASEKLNAIIRNTQLDETRIEHSQVVFFSASDPYTGLYPLMLRCYDGKPLPRSWWTLSMAPFAHRLTRTSEREMEMEVVNGQLFTSVFERLFRSKYRKMQPGQTIDLDGLIVTVLECGDVGPTRFKLAFAESPDAPRYQLLTFQRGKYKRINAPEIGETIELPFGFK